MKNLLYLFIILFLASCKVNEPKEPFKIDPNATILIKPDMKGWQNPAMRVKSENPEHLSALEIVKQGSAIAWHWTGAGIDGSAGFNDGQRDLETPALKMFSSWIINLDADLEPYYVPDFIEGKNCVIWRVVNNERDTIAYIPNSVLRTAQPLIKEAYDNGDAETVYTLFNEAFTFLPITADEWRALEN